jgi:hypothetical protein
MITSEPGRGTGGGWIPPLVVRTAGAGALATVVMDAAMVGAAAVGGRAFASERLDPQIIGRWAAGLMRGRLRHVEITGEQPVPGELALGIATHYATGAILAGVFLLAPGRRTHPFASAVAYGIATAVLPLLVLFPSLGYGPFGIRSGEAALLNRVMLVGHVAFGVGLGFWVPRVVRR